MDEKKDKPEPKEPEIPVKPMCTCMSDPFASLPPDLRPSLKKDDGLRKVTCPGCGLVYSTNRKTDVCMVCEKKGVRMPDSDSNPPSA